MLIPGKLPMKEGYKSSKLKPNMHVTRIVIGVFVTNKLGCISCVFLDYSVRNHLNALSRL